MRALLVAGLLLLLAAPAEARLDRGFASGKGWRAFTVGAYESGADAIIRTRSGKLLVGGFSDYPRLGFARFHPSGRLDRRFGRRGRAIVDTGDAGTIVGLHELSNRRLLFAYAAYGMEGVSFRVVRLLPDGSLDLTYGEGGVARIAPPYGDARLAGMAVLRGGAVVLAGTVGVAPARVVIARVDGDGRPSGEVRTVIEGATAAGLVRTRLGHLVLAANRQRAEGRRAAAIITGLGANPFRREFEGVTLLDIDRDRSGGVGLLLRSGPRWGVRRFAEDFTPRRAPGKLTSRGTPGGLAIAPGSRAWVGFPGGGMRLVRPDGRLDRRGRSNGPRTRHLLDTAELVTLPHNRVAAVGRVVPEDTGDIREDYAPSKMWIARYRR